MVIEVSKITNVSVEDILGVKRCQNISEARQLYWKLLYDNGYSLSLIGKLCNRTHATILHGITHITNLIEIDKNVAMMWLQIKEIN